VRQVRRAVDLRVRVWVPWLAMLVLAIVLLKGLVLVLEPRMAFFPIAGEQTTPRDRGLSYETLRIRTEDGETLSAWWLPREEAFADVLFFHGNGGNLSIWLDVIELMHRQGLAVLAIDYRGYGTSTGRPTEAGLYTDAAAAVAKFQSRLRTIGRPAVYWGRSLGGTVAAYATSIAKPDGLILESTFPDASWVKALNPVMTVLGVFSSYRFPTAEFLKDYDRATLVMHGEADAIVPFAQGRLLFERIAGPKRFARIDGLDHNDLAVLSNHGYWESVRSFVSGLRAGPPR
jgi:fermentation-respiration switch protein FrsA (DUF1100 family)